LCCSAWRTEEKGWEMKSWIGMVKGRRVIYTKDDDFGGVKLIGNNIIIILGIECDGNGLRGKEEG